MEFVEATKETQDAFFCCLTDCKIEDSENAQIRQKWHNEHKDKGCSAKVLRLDNGEVVGRCHTAPIKYSPLIGNDLMLILCLYVHMYQRHKGDQRGKGFGKYMLERIEEDARASGFKGLAAWAMVWDWNPVSFYEHLGFSRADQEDKAVAIWKPFCADAEPPKLMRLPALPIHKQAKIHVFAADNAWCNGCNKLRIVREAIEGLENIVDYHEAGAPHQNRIIHLGNVGGVFLDGKVYRPYQLIGKSDDLRAEILRLYEVKKNQ
ncbi:GNAT family N-acetyltransferase [candidate division KSB1 bacterium]|nr:GNAT family N-acetyltransferase [candidate division KSB1 bacterium]